MSSNWTCEERMIAVGDMPERPKGAIIDRDRAVELISAQSGDGPGDRSTDHLFFLMIGAHRYPVAATIAVKKVHKKGGERGLMEWLVTNDFTASAGDMSRLGFPPSRYPLATVGEHHSLETVRDLALEALCFFGRAGNSLGLLDVVEWRASHGDIVRSVDEFV
tara:strand:+ start:11820 stop:12308 length:489 start_codon:yes stop_codon:yes gene_type:complete